MRFEFKRLMAFILVLTVSVVVTGCSTVTKPNEDDYPDGDEVERIINLQMREADTLDPLMTTRQSVRDGLLTVYEPLFNVTETFDVENVLAETYAFNQSATVMTLKIKQGVLWHNNNVFTADDVVYTINRIKENKESSYYLNLETVDRVEKINDYEVVFYLNKPNAFLVYSLYFPIVHVSAGDAVIGTGAYMFEKTDGKSLTLKKNSAWHLGEVNADGVKFLYMRTSAMAQEAFSSGKIHAVTKDMLDIENFAIKESQKTYTYPDGIFEFIGFNANKGIFADPLLRIATSNAIDRSAIANVFGSAIGAGFPIMIGSSLFSPSYETASYSLDYAKEIIFSAGWSDSDYDLRPEKVIDGKTEELEFTLLVADRDAQRQLAAKEVEKQLELAGFSVKLEVVDIATYNEKIAGGEYDAFLGAVYCDAPYDISDLLSSTGYVNYQGYDSVDMDLALSRLSGAVDREAAAKAFSEVQALYIAHQPIAGLCFKTSYVVTSNVIGGEVKPYPFSPYANIALWSIE